MPSDELTPEQKRRVVQREKERHGSSSKVRVENRPDANGNIPVVVEKFEEREGVEPPPRRKT